MVNSRLTTFTSQRLEARCRTNSYKRKTNRRADYDCQFTVRQLHADLILQM